MIDEYKKRQSLYYTWYHMISRCYNSDHPAYLQYGGRGIRVCDRYTDTTKLQRKGRGRLVSQGFLNFLEDMGPSWFYGTGKDAATLDRIDNDGDYCFENCRWLTKSEHCSRTHQGVAESEESRQKRSAALMGHSVSIETRKKISKNNAMNNPLNRKKISDTKRMKRCI